MNSKISILLLILVIGIHAEMKPIKVGKGSYASTPPANKGTSRLYTIKPHIEKESQGKPLPTNDWWTSLLSETPFPGKMWAYPLTVSADSNGPLIWFCNEWNDKGTEMKLGQPLKISAVDSGPKDPNADLLLFDFEAQNWGKWSVEGDAFGPSPMTEKKHKLFKYAGNRYACSFDKGDRGTGKLTSPEFTINRNFLKFLIAGGKDKNKLGVFLTIGGKRVLHAVGKNGVECHWKTWDVKKFIGKKARIEISDQSKGGWGFIAADHFLLSNQEGMASSGIFSHASTKNWGDWTVSMRLNAGKEKHFDVTFGRGLPYTWIESSGLDMEVSSQIHKLLTLDGQTVKLPLKSDALIVEVDGRLYGLFAPDNTSFLLKNKKLQIRSAEKNLFLIVAAIPEISKAEELYKYAFAIPRKSKFDWQYDQSKGAVSTTWTATTEALKGTNKKLLQGWIPHHWRITENDLKFSGTTYQTQRGLLKLAPGNEFKISWPFQGMVPSFPLPEKSSQKSNYSEKILTDYLDKWISEKQNKTKRQRYRADTYWGGKDFLKMSQVMTIAGQMKHPKFEIVKEMTKEALTDWLTFSPGEKEYFFAKYEAPWNGLVGFKPSFGSETFTDNHFHYGYTILAAALLGLQDKEWIDAYKDILILIAKQYANWERDDKDFPFLRTFDPWGGHSYAGGMSSNHDGNNQESSSEAMGSWAGLFLLGDVISNDKMRACGAMGYAIEAEAIHEYWNDYYGWKKGQKASNYSEKYKHTIVSVLRDRDIGFWTWFSGEPKHIYGIQWLPVWTTMHYLAKDAEFVDYQVENMLKKQGKGKPYNISNIDRDWGHVTLGYKLWGNTLEACKILDLERKSNRPIGDYRNGGLSYFLAHSYNSLGRVAPEYHTSLPSSLVFKNEEKIKVILMNHSTEDKEVTIYKDGKEIKKVSAPANTLHTHHID